MYFFFLYMYFYLVWWFYCEDLIRLPAMSFYEACFNWTDVKSLLTMYCVVFSVSFSLNKFSKKFKSTGLVKTILKILWFKKRKNLTVVNLFPWFCRMNFSDGVTWELQKQANCFFFFFFHLHLLNGSEKDTL